MNNTTQNSTTPKFTSTVLADCACERNVFLAKMNFGNGNHAFLEVRKALISNKEWIFFIRNENAYLAFVRCDNYRPVPHFFAWRFPRTRFRRFLAAKWNPDAVGIGNNRWIDLLVYRVAA